MLETERGDRAADCVPPFEIVVQHAEDLCFAEKFASGVVDGDVLAGLPLMHEYGMVYKDSGRGRGAGNSARLCAKTDKSEKGQQVHSPHHSQGRQGH
jgi:hypothetical protein